MERTVRPIQREVPVMHSAGQDAERLGLRHMVDSVGQSGHLVVAHCLGSHGRDFRAPRTLAAALMTVVGMGLASDQFHCHWERRERGSSMDHEGMIGEDHQQEYG